MGILRGENHARWEECLVIREVDPGCIVRPLILCTTILGFSKHAQYLYIS